MVQERRFTPRHPVDFKLQLTTNQQQFTVVAVNLSAEGIQVKCDDHCADILSKTQCHPLNCQIAINLPFDLPLSSAMTKPLTIDCRIIIKRRLSQSSYLLGIKFIDLNAGDRDRLMSCYR